MRGKTREQKDAENAMRERLRLRLKALVERRCPQSVLSASYQRTIDFKEAMDKARKALASSKATAERLQLCGNALEQFQ